MNSLFTRTLLVTLSVWFSSVQNAQSAVTALFAFGDSILDTGNNNKMMFGRGDFYPYGKDFVNHSSTGRYSNGRVATDLIAEGLGIKQTVPAYRKPDLRPNDLLTGVSFASGGSGLDQLTTQMTRSISVKDQVKDFKHYIANLTSVTRDQNRTQSIISNAVFIICAGNNDLGFTYFSGMRMQYNMIRYTDLLVTWTHSLLKDLYDLGARKFAVMGTLPLGCLPTHTNVLAGLCLENTNTAAKTFNRKLSAELNNLNAKLPTARFVYIDMYHSYRELIRNPKKYGFETGIKPCIATLSMNPVACKDSSRHVFFDYVHPSEQSLRVVLAPVMDQLRHNFA